MVITASNLLACGSSTAPCVSPPALCRPRRLGFACTRTALPLRRCSQLFRCLRDRSEVQETVESLTADDNLSTDIDSEEDVGDLVVKNDRISFDSVDGLVNGLVLISPFFCWGTAMVAIKGSIDHTTPLFIASVRLFPAGILTVGAASLLKRPQPSTAMAWWAITVFAIVDATIFQAALSRGLLTVGAGLGSVVIDSQPLTVAILCAVFFGERLSSNGLIGLGIGVLGLLLLELPEGATGGLDISQLMQPPEGLGWMFLSAQAMAVGTVMVRWVTKYADPVSATGWHMIIGSLPLIAACFIQDGSLAVENLELPDVFRLVYMSVIGGAVGYGIFFTLASREDESLTKLSVLTFLTPAFAASFGYLFLGETLSATQLLGAVVTLSAVSLVEGSSSTEDVM